MSALAGIDSVALWHGVAALLLAACRCGPLLLAIPLLGIAGRIAALCLGTLLAAPLIAPAAPAVPGDGWLYLRELLIGGTLALAAALPWAVMHSVGALLDEVRAARASRSQPAASLYGAVALASFFALGGARTVVTALAASYELLPLGPASHPEPAVTALAAASGLTLLVARLLALSLHLAVPLLAAQLLAELFVVLLGRFAQGPKTKPATTMTATRALIWLVVLLLSAPALFPTLRHLLTLWPQLFRATLSTH